MTRTFPIHVAIIMDGNGRWATGRSLPRYEGHLAGVIALRRTVERAIEQGVCTLTVYAFSSDNWKRPRSEVSALMLLFRHYLLTEAAACRKQGVRISVIGRRDRLPESLLPLIKQTEQSTRHCPRLHLRLAIDYSSRDAILRAARHAQSREEFAEALGPDVDLLIRTAGEQRLSDFLLWESAYAELVFEPERWPDFDAACLDRALAAYSKRQRKFGGLSPEAAA